MGYYWSPSLGQHEFELRGRPLRYLLVTLLVDAGTSLSIRELVAGCEAEGVVFAGRPSKIVSDALRWERRRGRVRRPARGVYEVGRIPSSTKRWIGHRVGQIRWWFHLLAGWRSSSGCSRTMAQEQLVWRGVSWVPGWPCWPSLDEP